MIEVLEVKEVAQILKIKESTVRALMRRNELAGKKIAGKWIITKDILLRYIEGK